MTPAHRFPIRVYFEDTDAGGVAYHANYLRWAERARTESLRDMGLPHSVMISDHNSMLMVRRIEVEYQRPARLDDGLIVETRVLRAGGASLDLLQLVLRGDGVLARLKVGLVCVGLDGRAMRLPEPWRSRFGEIAEGEGPAPAAR